MWSRSNRFIGTVYYRGCKLGIVSSVTSIGRDAFYWCFSLTKVNYLGTIDQWAEIEFEASDSNPTYFTEDLYIQGELVEEVKITTATKIGACAFYNCQSIKSIEIPDSVTSIGDGAFGGCSSLTSIVIPDSVTSIGDNAFSSCASVTSIEIPDSVTSIGSSAFYNCSSLTKVNYLGTINQWVEIEFENSNSNPTYYAEDLYIQGKLVEEVKITTATKILSYAFRNCKSIKSVEIGNSVTSIGSSAFYNCTNLQYNIKDGVKYLGNEINKYLFAVSVVDVEGSVVRIAESCKNLVYCSFDEYDGRIYFEGAMEQWNKIIKSEWWRGYDSSASYVQCLDGRVYF